MLAESLSGLGFYIEAVLHQRPDRDRLIAPLIAKRLGEAPAPVAVEPQSVEDSVAELRAALPRLVADVRNAPTDALARDELRAKLASLRDDADLIGDAELVAQANAALNEIDAGGKDAALAASVDLIVESGVAPAPAISEETQRLLATDASALDAELLDIYLTEADEVLDTIAEHRRMLDHSPGDREALVTVRRQFHTLKGSGRMVGLTELGELAWDVERMHNRLLEEDRRVTPAVLALIGVAADDVSAVGARAARHRPHRHRCRAAAVRAARGRSRIPRRDAFAAVPPPRSKPDPGDRRFADRSDRSTGIRRIAADAHARGSRRQWRDARRRARVGRRPSGAERRDVCAGERNRRARSDAQTCGRRLAVAVDRCRLARTGRRRRRGSIDAGSRARRLSRARHAAGGGRRADRHRCSRSRSAKRSTSVCRSTCATPRNRCCAWSRTIRRRSPARPTQLRAPTTACAGAHAADRRRAWPEPAARPEPDEVIVGAVTLSASLWRILCDEAEQNVAVLQHEVSVLQFDPEHCRSPRWCARATRCAASTAPVASR